MSISLKPDVKCVTKYEWYVNLYWKMPQNWSIHLIFYLKMKCIFKAFMPWISYSMKKQNNIPLLTLIKANVILTLAVVTLCYLLYPVYTLCITCYQWLLHYFAFQSFNMNLPETHRYHYGPLWPLSYGIWIYNYLCNQWLSPLMLWVRISITPRYIA